jgi:hypothetical protein
VFVGGRMLAGQFTAEDMAELAGLGG